MLKIYGSSMCPDCIYCKEAFDKEGIKYEFIDINSDLKLFKEFLKLRDNSPVFDICKEKGYIGIPAIVSEDGKISLDTEEYLAEIKGTNVKVIKDTEPDNWPVTKEEIVKALTEIGLTRADNVMVHASLSKLGYGMWRGTDCYRGDYGNGGR